MKQGKTLWNYWTTFRLLFISRAKKRKLRDACTLLNDNPAYRRIKARAIDATIWGEIGKGNPLEEEDDSGVYYDAMGCPSWFRGTDEARIQDALTEGMLQGASFEDICYAMAAAIAGEEVNA